jgi:hypothetical protein
LSETNNFTKTNPAPNSSIGPPEINNNLVILGVREMGRTLNAVRYASDIAGEVMYRTSPVTVTASGFQRLSEVKAMLHSEPIDLGTFRVDEYGKLVGNITIPDWVPIGFHTLHLYGKDVSGRPIDMQRVVFVAASDDDYDGDGIDNINDPCLIFDPSGEDHDRDGIDDACDGQIGETPQSESGSDSKPPENNPETVAGDEDFVLFQQTVSPQISGNTLSGSISVDGGNNNQTIKQDKSSSVRPTVAGIYASKTGANNDGSNNIHKTYKVWLEIIGMVIVLGSLVFLFQKHNQRN